MGILYSFRELFLFDLPVVYLNFTRSHRTFYLTELLSIGMGIYVKCFGFMAFECKIRYNYTNKLTKKGRLT